MAFIAARSLRTERSSRSLPKNWAMNLSRARRPHCAGFGATRGGAVAIGTPAATAVVEGSEEGAAAAVVLACHSVPNATARSVPSGKPAAASSMVSLIQRMNLSRRSISTAASALRALDALATVAVAAVAVAAAAAGGGG